MMLKILSTSHRSLVLIIMSRDAPQTTNHLFNGHFLQDNLAFSTRTILDFSGVRDDGGGNAISWTM